MRVCEIFRSIQGEGEYIGFPTVFIRLSGCNLRCSWCDTKYALEEGEEMKPVDVIKEVEELYRTGDRVSITGGEPLLQIDDGLEDLVALLRHRVHVREVDIETNGTIAPTRMLGNNCRFEISPKLTNSGQRVAYDIRWLRLVRDYHFKFIVVEEGDFGEIEEFIAKFNIPREKVSVQPNGMVKDYIGEMRKVAEWAKEHDFRFIPQLHRILWGVRRGV